MPATERRHEFSAVGGLYRFLKSVGVLPDAGRKGLGKVFGEVVRDVVGRPHLLKSDDEAVTGDLVPSESETFVGEVVTFEKDVQVGVPTLVLRTPGYFEDSETTADVVAPEIRATKAGEGLQEMVEGVVKGQVESADCEGEEAKLNTGEGFAHVGGDESAALLLAGNTEAVTAAVGRDAVAVGGLARTLDPGMRPARGEALQLTRKIGVAGPVDGRELVEGNQRSVGGSSLAGPGRMTKADVEVSWRVRGTFVRIKGRRPAG